MHLSLKIICLFHLATFLAACIHAGLRIHEVGYAGPDIIPPIPQSTELRELDTGAPTAIEIHVFLYTRVNETRHLLSQLAMSNYSSYPWPIPLVLHLDRPPNNEPEEQGGSSSPTMEIQRIVSDYEWPYGPKHIDIKTAHTGLESSWLTAWSPPNPDAIMIAFEDDLEISPLHFQWLLKVLAEYDLWTDATRDPRLLGLCLSPIVFDEISVSKIVYERPWLSSHHVAPSFPVYLHGVPCSWGAIYFGKQWREFLHFYELRGHPPFFDRTNASQPRDDPNLWLPNSYSNEWLRSWKRFMFDFAYGRGAYLLYPNLKEDAGFARTLRLKGEHYAGIDLPLRRDVPLVTHMEQMHYDRRWPGYDALPLIDMYCKSTSRMVYAEQGKGFVDGIRVYHSSAYEELAERWALEE